MTDEEKTYRAVITELAGHMQGLKQAQKLGVSWPKLTRLLSDPETEVHELVDLLEGDDG